MWLRTTTPLVPSWPGKVNGYFWMLLVQTWTWVACTWSIPSLWFSVWQDAVFPNPTTFDATRKPRERYLRPNVAFNLIGADVAPKLMAQVLRSILSLEKVRRGPGYFGKLQRFQDDSAMDLCYVYLNAQQLRSPWPTSLVILYDASAWSGGLADIPLVLTPQAWTDKSRQLSQCKSINKFRLRNRQGSHQIHCSMYI